jgi:prefoldin subunit 5
MFKRVLGIVVIVISILVLIISLGGVVGTWVVRADVARLVENVVSQTDAALQRAEDGVSRLNNQLDQTGSNISTITTTINTIGDQVEANNVILQAIDQIAGTSLVPALENLQTTANDLYDKLVAVNSKVETLSQIPPFRGKGDVLDKASNVLTGLQEALQNLANFRQAVSDAKSSVTQKTVAVLTAPLNRLNNTLQTIQTAITGVQQTLGDLQTSLATFQTTVISWLNIAAILITLLLLWIALSQYSLILHGWAMFKDSGEAETPTLTSPETSTATQATANAVKLPKEEPEDVSEPVQGDTGEKDGAQKDLNN